MPGEHPLPPSQLDDLLADGPLVVLGVTWSAPTTAGCLLRVRRSRLSPASVLVPVVGLTLNYSAAADNRRHCIGHRSPRRNEGRYLDCPNPPQAGEKTCVSCAVAEAELAADLHHAHTRDASEIHAAVRRHLDQDNVLYLAAFRDGSIKIGTSTAARRLLRWTEQGAWMVAEVATAADGFEVRRLEDRITDELGFPQAVAGTRKLRGMAMPRTDRELEVQLDDAVAATHELLGGTSAKLGDERWRFPGSEQPIWDRLHPYPAKLTKGRHHLQIEAACGRLAVFTKPGSTDRFIADLGPLAGHQIDLGRFTPDQVMVQDSLF